MMPPILSVVPPSRQFPAPTKPFDTEAAVLAAANVTSDDECFAGVTWIAGQDAPRAARIVMVRSGVSRDCQALAEHLVARMRAIELPPPISPHKHVSFESVEDAARASSVLCKAGLKRENLSFYGVAAARLSSGERLSLDALVGDEAWREWAEVERVILTEALAPLPVSDAMLDRAVEFKRHQQRESPPIRRYIGRDADGAPVAMIGYAPFARCDLGFAKAGVLVRLRDVAVLPHARGRGIGTALLRAIARRAIEECEATQILICGAADGIPASLYRSIGASTIGSCALFSGEVK